MTHILQPEVAAQALSLHLAGVDTAQIAQTLHAERQQIDDALYDILAERHPGRSPEQAAELERLATLWRNLYADGLAGDTSAAKTALQLFQLMTDLRSRPIEFEPATTPTASIRDAWNDLALGATEAVEALRQIIRSGRSESVRARAAMTLLSRTGITERVELAASVRVATQAMDADDASTVGKSAAQVVTERLDALKARQELLIGVDADPPIVVDADPGA